MKTMNRLQSILAAVALLLGVVTASASNEGLWRPVVWEACEPVVIPWKSTVQEAMSGLRRAGVMGVQRTGSAEAGTLTMAFNDGKRNEVVQMIFDAQGQYIGAATSHKTTSPENAKACVANVVGRLVVAGAKVISRSPSSTDLRVTCNGVDLTITMGIQDGDASVAFMNVMVEPTTIRSAFTE